MSEWCQNKKCPEKRNQNQIRGSKGAKYYQSNKHNNYYQYWCSMGCRDEWWKEHADTCMNAVGFIDKQILPLEDAWYVTYVWGHYSDANPQYLLINKLKGVKQSITREQAQTEDMIQRGYDYAVIDRTQAKELATTLGLAS